MALIAGTLAWVDYALGDVPSATAWFARSLVGSYAIRDVASSTVSLPVGAVVAIENDRPGDAVALMGAFEALTQRYGVKPPGPLLRLIYEADPLATASGRLTTEVPHYHARAPATYSMRDLASTRLAAGRGARGVPRAPGDAVALMGAFDALCERYGVRPPVPFANSSISPIPLAEASALLATEEVAEHTRRGRRMTLGEAVALTLEVGALDWPVGSGGGQ